MTRVLRLVSQMKLRQKIVLSTSVLLILSTAVSVALLYNQSKSILEENSYKETKQMITQLSNYYSEKLAKIITIAHDVIEDTSFKRSLGNVVWNDHYNYAKEASMIQDLFQKGMMKDRLISSMFIYTPNGVFYDNLHTPIDVETLEGGSYFENLPMRHNIFWGRAQKDRVFQGEERIIPIIFNIEIDGYYDEIYLVVNISEKAVMKQLKEISNMNSTNVYLINNEGKIVTKSEEGDFINERDIQSLDLYTGKNGYFKYKNGKEELYINYAQIDLNRWTAISVRSYSDLMKKASNLQEFALTIGGILLLISTSLAFILAATVTRPLKRLKKTMEKIQKGNLQTRFLGEANDEIGQLGKSFNRMLDQIENLIKQLEEEKQKTKIEQAQKIRAEIQVLQAQINPHFLYNTLDTIYWKSIRADNQLVGDMIISLSDMLRIGLGKGKDIISVKEEIEHVKNYLYLQTNVYKDKFEYKMQISEDVLELSTVKLLLQPLVENSILHGFNNITYKGCIVIRVLNIKENIEFTVIDNGSGFDVNTDIGKGFALKNVYERIKLHYGEAGNMEYFSEPYEETIVKIIIPSQSNPGGTHV